MRTIVDLKTGKVYRVSPTFSQLLTKTTITVGVIRPRDHKIMGWKFNRKTHLDVSTKSYVLIGDDF